ncbi:MAG: hypothetical protein LBD79_03545 [Treponema sp.]|jgi:hypothetical protein|nr:hypothetical protein [Treponema sp.]
MNLSRRNKFFKAGIILSSLFLVLSIAGSFVAMPEYPLAVADAARRVSGLLQPLISHFCVPDSYAPFFSMACAVLYAFVAAIVIYSSFEQTRCQEILFFGFFAFSFAFEACRILPPLSQQYAFPSFYLVVGARVMLFGRYFGLFSLFASSACAAGLEVEKQRILLWIIILTTLLIVSGIPVDSLSWDSSLCMIRAYSELFNMLELCLVCVTTLSFFITAYSRNSTEYVFIGVGSLLVALGRSLLFSSDTWITLLPALAALAVGTWFVCAHLHRMYLWL